MNKLKYNFQIKSTKKQAKALIITFIVLAVLYLIFLSIPEPSDAVGITFLVLIFGDLFTGCGIVLGENAKLVKKFKEDAKAEYAREEIYEKEIKLFIEQQEDFEYSTATEDEKINHVLFALIKGATLFSTEALYIECRDYSLDEIKQIMSKFKLTEDFKKYLENVVYQRKTSKEFNRFYIEIEFLLKNRLFNTPLDEVMFRNDVLYSQYHNLRAYYNYRPDFKKYEVVFEFYTDKYGFPKWNNLLKENFYKTREQAIAKCNSLMKVAYKKADPKVNEIVDLDVNAMKFSILYILHTKQKVAEPYGSIGQYFELIHQEGHYGMFNEDPSGSLTIINRFNGIIPDEYYGKLLLTYNCRDNLERCKEMDKYYDDHFDEIQLILQEYSKTLEYNIFK